MRITFPRVMLCLAVTIATVTATRTTQATPVARNEQSEIRGEVEAELVRLGVAPDEARLRVAALSDEELAKVRGQVATMPAGGDSTVTMGIGTAILIALLLIIFL